jgi:hypothetical protein
MVYNIYRVYNCHILFAAMFSYESLHTCHLFAAMFSYESSHTCHLFAAMFSYESLQICYIDWSYNW